MTDKPKPKRRWLQFSLRTLMLVVTVFCVWLGITAIRVRDQERTVEMIRELGGVVQYEHEINRTEPPTPEWLRQFIGDEYFFRVAFVRLSGPKVNDAILSEIKQLTDLKVLVLNSSELTNAGLAHLKDLTNLKFLHLVNTKITDAGLVHLKELTNLTSLNLNNTQISDAGLVHLKGLTNLRQLVLDSTKVTNAGLVHLIELTELRLLFVNNTQVTYEDIKKLRRALPNLLDHDHYRQRRKGIPAGTAELQDRPLAQ